MDFKNNGVPEGNVIVQTNDGGEGNHLIDVAFIELELTDSNIKKWFPSIEKQCNYELPDYFQLEGGIEPDENGQICCVFNGLHYYLCIPVENKDLLKPFGNIVYEIVKKVDKKQLNKNHEIFYWGIGCIPELKPIR